MSQGIQEQTNGRFAAPEAFLSGLDADAASALITAAADVVLVLDESGVIQDLAFSSEELSSHGCGSWLGKPWTQTVTVESKPKVDALLRNAGAGGEVKWRHVNHPSAEGPDLPLSYAVVPVQRKGLGKAHTFAFGRDLRAQMALQQRLVSAQLSMERDYWRLRHVETRYRLLFQIASEAVLIIDAATNKLEEANPAALKLLGEKVLRPGWALADSLDSAGALAVRQLLDRSRASGKADPLVACLSDGALEVTIAVSLFRQDSSPHFLVRMAPSKVPAPVEDGGGKGLLLKVMESAPDALVVTDLDGRVLSVNRAFLELVHLPNEESAQGQSLERWLGRSGVDLRVLISNLRQHGMVRLFATRVRGEYGETAEVEISAVSVTSGDQPCLGFNIRDVGRRLVAEARAPRELPRSASQMTDLVGRVPLRDIVRETTDLIEQLCIEAALELTQDNRASAAEMLGLSRQSLYIKLRRFGIGEPSPEVGQ